MLTLAFASATAHVARYTLCNNAVFQDAKSQEECNKISDSAYAEQEKLMKQGEMHWHTVGDASESAILKFCEVRKEAYASQEGWSAISDSTPKFKRVETARNSFPLVAEIPFNSKHKYQASVHFDAASESHFIVMKGAPERVVIRCGQVMLGDEVVPLNEERIKQFEANNAALAREGERVLGYCMTQLPKVRVHS